MDGVILTLITLILIVSQLSSGTLGCAESEVRFNSLLNYTNFQVNVRLNLLNSKSASSWQSSITESYSNKYNKARLDIHIDSTSNGIQYFYDDFDKGRLVKKEFGSWCSLANEFEFAHDLFGIASSAYSFLSGVQWFTRRHGVPDHIIGLARLLIILQANKDKHIFVSEDVVNNLKTYKYAIEDSFYTGIKIYAYYSKFAFDWPDTGTPSRIEIYLNDGANLVVDYFMVKPIFLLGLVDEIESSNFFTFPIGFACSRTMRSFDLLRGSKSHKVVSFKTDTQVYDSKDHFGELFISYDGYLNAMRVETPMKTSGSNKFVSRTIFDFTSKMKYNYYENPSSEEMECVAAEIVADTSELETVLSFRKLVYMGTLFVRGIKTEVFEKLTFDLPTLLFPKASFKDTRGKCYTSYSLNSESSLIGTNEFTIIYYFSTSNSTSDTVLQIVNKPLGSLMRVEVFQEEILKYRVEIFNFVWHLTEAPNGESEEFLFKLESSCTVPDSSTRSSLKMELEYNLSKQDTLFDQTLGVLDNSKSRNTASIRALLSGSNITTTQVYDWTSRFTLLNEKISILQIVARLVKPITYFYEAVMVDEGAPLTLEEVRPYMVYAECFWKAVHLRKQTGHILFSYCNNQCIIDLNPIFNYNISSGQDIYKSSSKFKSTKNGKLVCQILRIDRRIIAGSTIFPEFNWLNEFRNLRAKTLYLPIPNHKDEVSFSMDIKMLEIYNDKWSASENKGEKGERGGSSGFDLAGLGLLPNNAAQVVLDIDKKYSTLDSVKFRELNTMNYELCHANCLTNMSCNSFSLCLNSKQHDQVECLVSDLNLKDSNVFERVSDQLKVNPGREASTLEIVLDSHTNNEENDNPRNPLQVKLRLNRRCHTYLKNPLELFKAPSFVSNASRNKNHLISVKNEEECALRCLNRNLKIIRQSTDTYLELLSSVNQNLKQMSEKNGKNRWCNKFDYINIGSSNLNDPAILQLSTTLIESVSKKGFCILPEVDRIIGNGMVTFSLRTYEFRYSSLYRKQHGIRLKSFSPKNIKKDVQQDQTNVGNNQVVLREFDVENCARACFENTIVMMPPCRSFDVLQVIVNDRDTGDEIRSFNCFFNSITSTEARQSYHVEHLVDEKSYNTTFIHYEPLYGQKDFVSNRIIGLENSEEKMDSLLSKTGVLLILCLSLVSGFLLGVYSSENISKWIIRMRKKAIDRSSTFITSMAGTQDQTHSTHFRFDL